jgi:predicted acetyltransferase
VRKIEVADRPLVEPLPLLLGDSRHAVLADPSDFLWARLLDLPAVLATRRYDSAGAIVLEVVDGFTPAWSGRFVLSVDDSGAATCEATTAAPDLTVTAADVAAASLGGTPLWPAAWIGRVDEHTARAVQRFDALFTTQPAPFCNTWF